MAEWKLYDGDSSHFASGEFYADREAAPHIDQAAHRPRLLQSVEFVRAAKRDFKIDNVVDFGAGDGGFLQQIQDLDVVSWGYDLQPANVKAAAGRGADVRFGNFLTDEIDYAELAVCTEVIEHLERPHEFLVQLAHHCDFLVASSPNNETGSNHYEFHLWAWDNAGYTEMLRHAGWELIQQADLFPFQVCYARAAR